MPEKCPNCGKSDHVKCVDFNDEGTYNIYICERCWGTWGVVTIKELICPKCGSSLNRKLLFPDDSTLEDARRCLNCNIIFNTEYAKECQINLLRKVIDARNNGS